VYTSLAYMECQFLVCGSHNISPSLKKTSVFLKKCKFVETDFSQDDNRPAMRKNQLVKHWPNPVVVRNILSPTGFAIFYPSFIHSLGLGCPG
jgi:hypothetical protein